MKAPEVRTQGCKKPQRRQHYSTPGCYLQEVAGSKGAGLAPQGVEVNSVGPRNGQKSGFGGTVRMEKVL